MPYWEPDCEQDVDARQRWFAAADRIATGITELAHLDAFVDPARYRVGFSCGGDADLAFAYALAIQSENVDARAVSPHPGRPADEVLLPCRPDATDEEVTHAVLATMKASHALEF